MSHFDSHSINWRVTIPLGASLLLSWDRRVTGLTRELGRAGGGGAKIDSGGADARVFANYVRDFEGMALPLRPSHI